MTWALECTETHRLPSVSLGKLSFFNELLIFYFFFVLFTAENTRKCVCGEKKAGGAEVETGNGAGLQLRASCD